MKYLVTINDDELRSNGDYLDIDEVADEVGELLRSGYYFVEKVEEWN